MTGMPVAPCPAQSCPPVGILTPIGGRAGQQTARGGSLPWLALPLMAPIRVGQLGPTSAWIYALGL